MLFMFNNSHSFCATKGNIVALSRKKLLLAEDFLCTKQSVIP